MRINQERVERYTKAFNSGALKLGMQDTPQLFHLCRAKAIQACIALKALDRTDDIEIIQ